MKIKGFQKLTLLDYKGYLAATVFTGGCNFICPFCHNSDLVLHPKEVPNISSDEVIKALEERKHKLEAVCISGGEPTLQPDLPIFISRIRALGYKIKLDTNGYKPDVLDYLFKHHLLDYVAMDIKNCKEKYAMTTGISGLELSRIEKSIQLIMQSSISYEFRTTIAKELHTKEDIDSISRWISGASNYYLQAYKEAENVIHPVYSSYKKKELEEFKKTAQNHVKHVDIIGL